jgi:hypothetical protein
MTDFRLRSHSTPRDLLVGLIVFTVACQRQRPTITTVPTSGTSRPEAPAPVTVVNSGATLVRSVAERYVPNWYRSVTFTQKTTLALPSGGQIVQTYYEAGALPGRLRIDTDLQSKTGLLFVRDSIYNFTGGRLVRADTGLNELFVLGFDLYAQPPARSEALLRRLGFDLSRFHEATWKGKPIYVVGASRGDTTSKQFWVERERLLVVRTIGSTRRGRADTRFNEFVQHGGGWVATEVEQYVNGKRTILQELSAVRIGVTLPDALFDPGKWSSAPHWARK